MSPRNTRTGGVLESTILPALEKNGFVCESQVNVGVRLGGGRHRVDVRATHNTDGRTILVSLKWQQTSGTAEQKVPYEVLCLIDALRSQQDQYSRAYIVLGGEGWKLRNFYINELDKYLPHRPDVEILSLEKFIAEANRGRL